MFFEGVKIGFSLTGSYCTFETTIPQISKLIEEGADILPIMSFNAYNLNTKFGKATEFIKQIEDITKKKIIHTIQDAEPIGPQKLIDIMVIAPCTGNTVAKLANDIIDTPVTMATNALPICWQVMIQTGSKVLLHKE